ncbi:MAG: ABC transporter permease [Terriglobia bacterium]
MLRLRSIVEGLRTLFHKEKVEQEMDEELRGFLEAAAKDKMRSGMSQGAALRAARVEMGSLDGVKEEIRSSGWESTLETLWQDVRYSVRQLKRNPSFAAVSVITLGLGIGANTAIFTAANDFLLRPLPFGHSDRVVMVKWYNLKLGKSSGTVDPPTFKDWRDRNHVFTEVAAWSQGTGYYNLTGPEGPERIPAMQVSAAFFRVLGVRPVLGRAFSPEDDRAGASRVALISHALWQTRFGGNPGILGKTLILDGKDYAIIGVLPAGFRFSTTPEDVWTSLAGDLDGGRGGFFLNVIAWLKPGVSPAQAQANMDDHCAALSAQFPEHYRDMKVAVESLRDRYTQDLRPALLALLAAAALVLLIACADLANLLLARATARYKEIAVRRALGASRTRIVRQMLMEGVVLAFLGGSAGLLMAFAGVRVFYAVLPTGWQPLTRGGIDASVLIFALAISLLTVLLFAMAPAWSSTGFELNETLKEGMRNPLAGGRRRSYRAALVATEVALAAMLLTGAGLLIKSFARLSAVNMGFRSENVLTVRLARTKAGGDAFYRDVLDRVAGLPQVRAAGAVNYGPLSGGLWGQDIIIQGAPPRPPGDLIWAQHRCVSLGYFRAMGIPLVKGRTFEAPDANKDVVIISETMAKRYWPGEDPIGKRFGVNCAGVPCHWQSVVGVVGDIKELDAAAEPFASMYFLETSSKMTLVVRSAQDPTSLIADVRSIIHSIDPDQPLGDVRTMQNLMSESVAPQRLTVLISGLIAALALVLAMVGLYGVIAYSVAQRSHEFGIRMALGAGQKEILKMVVGQGLRVTAFGLVIGLAGAWAVTRLLRTILFAVEPTDPAVFALVLQVLIAVSLFASYWPARRATKVDPLVALRYE